MAVLVQRLLRCTHVNGNGRRVKKLSRAVCHAKGEFIQPNISTYKTRVLSPVVLCNLNRLEPTILASTFRRRTICALNFDPLSWSSESYAITSTLKRES
jgi:hypothetical protein